ncbi:MAG: RluA family pseudouridine synthase [Patescibacteria group bacterium]
MKKFEVTENKLRLDRFLAESFKEVSRSRIQKDIEAGLVFVNKEKVLEAKFVVRSGDIVEYDYTVEQKIQAKELDIKVIFENNDILIIDKPAGLVVHPAPGYKGVTLAEGLLHKYKDIKVIGEDEIRPGIVHRLDKDTSGVLFVAKSQKMFEHLKDSFQKRTVKKQYITLLAGHLPSKHGFINTPIGRHPTDFRKMTVNLPKEPKEAVTEYTVLEYLPFKGEKIKGHKSIDEFTLVRVNLHTGRTHQIRVHFSSLGFPIVGDALYGPKSNCSFGLDLKRQFLHASNIEVQLPDKTWVEAHADLPEDLKKVLIDLKAKNINL